MRSFLVGVIFTLAIGCTKRGDGPEAALEPADFSSPPSPKPPAIVRMADDYLASLPPEKTPKNLGWERDQFVNGFFKGFVTPTGTARGADGAWMEAFKAGQRFWHANPDKIKETFESFGYVAVEVEGVWSVRFEQCIFKPKGNRDSDDWWLWSFRTRFVTFPKTRVRRSKRSPFVSQVSSALKVTMDMVGVGTMKSAPPRFRKFADGGLVAGEYEMSV